ncbi:TetR family transcriptional regulator [Micromonospora pisi]|uniref:TetR family transcriptional regulator n=1 Tax=Micromonospora pisi TaxID=589240 RepID=A0A495JTU5_9ACTN|nr:TetR/AcrR family transcriptional regulator [Micromonospora pisi]RKR92430.1 TetR family transcriptional regulator [Micromonospora pisi]
MAKPRSPATRRQESAEFTQKVILEAARELFATQGYPATTVVDIAARARVAVATVYTSVGGKPTLLRALIQAGVQDPETARTQAAIQASSDPAEILRLLAAGTRHGNEQHAETVRLMATTAHVAPSASEAVREATESYREALHVVAVRLNELGALRAGLTVERAAHVLWFYFGLNAWSQLVDGGWSWDEAERWLIESATSALLSLPVAPATNTEA